MSTTFPDTDCEPSCDSVDTVYALDSLRELSEELSRRTLSDTQTGTTHNPAAITAHAVSSDSTNAQNTHLVPPVHSSEQRSAQAHVRLKPMIFRREAENGVRFSVREVLPTIWHGDVELPTDEEAEAETRYKLQVYDCIRAEASRRLCNGQNQSTTARRNVTQDIPVNISTDDDEDNRLMRQWESLVNTAVNTVIPDIFRAGLVVIVQEASWYELEWGELKQFIPDHEQIVSRWRERQRPRDQRTTGQRRQLDM